MSPDLALVRSPHRVYAALMRDERPPSAAGWLRRPLLASLAIGMSLTIAAAVCLHPTRVVALVSPSSAWTFLASLGLVALIFF